jgi:hypothetical protein
MNRGKSFVKKLLIATTICLFSAHSAQAFTYTEVGDAGQLIPAAQVIDLGNATSTSTDPDLTSITGNVARTNADMFGIFLTEGQLFTASTIPVGGANYNSQIFLFNDQGFGLIANDNSGGNRRSALSFTPTTSSVYYLAVSGFNYDPRDAQGNNIFAGNLTGQLLPNPQAGALDSWATNRATSATFNYALGMTGAKPVPEPIVGSGFLAFAVLGAASAFRPKKPLGV